MRSSLGDGLTCEAVWLTGCEAVWLTGQPCEARIKRATERRSPTAAWRTDVLIDLQSTYCRLDKRVGPRKSKYRQCYTSININCNIDISFSLAAAPSGQFRFHVRLRRQINGGVSRKEAVRFEGKARRLTRHDRKVCRQKSQNQNWVSIDYT
jgi:hypothetical protein